MPKKLLACRSYRTTIIDEMGYLPLDDLGATIFFQLVSARYERGSIILTSNKSYGARSADIMLPHTDKWTVPQTRR